MSIIFMPLPHPLYKKKCCQNGGCIQIYFYCNQNSVDKKKDNDCNLNASSAVLHYFYRMMFCQVSCVGNHLYEENVGADSVDTGIKDVFHVVFLFSYFFIKNTHDVLWQYFYSKFLVGVLTSFFNVCPIQYLNLI